MALDQIKANGGPNETPTVVLVNIANNYDWSSLEDAARFVVLITDEGYYEGKDIPTMASAVSALNAKNVSVAAIAKNNLAKSYASLVSGTGGQFISLSEDYNQILSGDLIQHIERVINEGRLVKIVTDRYDFLIEVVAVPKSLDFTTHIHHHALKHHHHNPCFKVSVKCEAIEEKPNGYGAMLPQTSSASETLLIEFGFMMLTASVAFAYGKKRYNG